MLMADDAGKQDPPSLDAFSKRLDAARRRRDDATNEQAVRGEALGQGFRVASELLAALIVGAGLGLGLDALAGWSPFGLLAGICVGFAAGVMNVSRALKRSTSAPDETD